MPLNLIYEPQYSGLSILAIVLYSIMLNRTKLSVGNPLFNDCGGAFIFFSNSQIQKVLRCNKDTARKTLNELKYYKLIRTEYQKRGLPLKIYINDIFHMNDLSRDSSKKHVYKPENNSKSDCGQKEVSFDVARAEELAKKRRHTFGQAPKRRTF